MTRTIEEVRDSILRASEGDDVAPTGRASVATLLVELAVERFVLGRSESGEPFAVPRSGPKLVHLLRGGRDSLRQRLAAEYMSEYGRVASQQALADALTTLEGQAQASTPERLYERVATHEGAIWFDLGTNTGEAVRIAGGTWSVQEAPPVLFRRTHLIGPMHRPCHGGSLDELFRWVNVTPADRPLVLAYLVAAFWPEVAHPILGIFGQQGSGKTTAMRALVLLIDGGPVPIRKPPRDADSWITAASGSWVVAIDNMSTIPDWLSDSLCRAVTGEGDVRRRLYTDGDLHVFAFRRVIALTGIDLGALSGDLADRLLPITLDVIDENDRRDETSMWSAWPEVQPRILGALLDLVAAVQERLPGVRLDRLPRMADFARIVRTVDDELGTAGLKRYLNDQGRLAADALTGDVFITRVAEVVTDRFEGTAAELLDRVTPVDEKWRKPKEWPGSARKVTQLLRRQAPVMRKAGWAVEEDGGRNKAGVARWELVAPRAEMADTSGPPATPNPAPRDSRIGEGGRQDRLALQAGHGGVEGGDNVPNGPYARVSETRLHRASSDSRGVAGQAGEARETSLAADAAGLVPQLRTAGDAAKVRR